MKNFLILILSIITLTMISNNNAEANMFNKFKKGFYFEKYSTAEEAKAALLELHPIGSDVDALVRTLEGAEMSIIETVTKEDAIKDKSKEKYFFKIVDHLIEPNHYKSDYVKVPNSTNAVSIYEYNAGVINPLLWKIWIWYDKNNKVTELDIVKHYMGL